MNPLGILFRNYSKYSASLLLNIRRVDKRKADETKLDPIMFSATERQPGQKIHWLKEEATMADYGLFIVANLMLDILLVIQVGQVFLWADYG